MSYLMGQVVIWVVVGFAACMVVTWMVWGRRLQRFDARLNEQKTMYEYCVAECGWLRQELAERTSDSGERTWPTEGRLSAGDAGDGGRHAQRLDPAGLVERLAESADDLTRIKGIGPKLNRLLNEQGIYQYSQLADLTREDIDQLDTRLRFRGRIDRDNWIEQARTLAGAGEARSSNSARDRLLEFSYSPSSKM